MVADGGSVDEPLAMSARHQIDKPPAHGQRRDDELKQPMVGAGKSGGVNQLVAPASSSSHVPAKEAGKRSKPEAPKFLLLLYEILQSENARVIKWSDDGLSLQILDPAVVTDKILPKYFNHTNFHSFQRQLNYFGFRKWTKSKTDICTFSHPYFRQHQPELLQLIKRKKAPRRTPVVEKAEAYTLPTVNALAASSSKKLLPLSPSGKRKLPIHEASEATPQQLLAHLSTSNVPIQPAINGIPINLVNQHSQISTRHPEAVSTYLPSASAMLNNVISPVAAGEVKKKAKKNDKKAYVPNRDFPTPMTSSPTESGDFSAAGLSNELMAAGNLSYTNTSLPTLDIVRNRIIRRQQVNDGNEQQQFGGYHGYPQSSQHGNTMIEPRPEMVNTSLPMVSASNGEQSPAFSNSFSDPVDILLRIKKSRAGSSDGHDTASPQKLAVEQNDNLASLHNFLLGHSLYTNRLESQLKLALDENEALKHLVDAKHREVEALQNDRKLLQHENSVLLDDKNKLFEINRDLLGKLFPQ